MFPMPLLTSNASLALPFFFVVFFFLIETGDSSVAAKYAKLQLVEFLALL